MFDGKMRKVVGKVADAIDDRAANYVESARKHDGTNRTNLMLRAGILSDIAAIFREAVAREGDDG